MEHFAFVTFVNFHYVKSQFFRFSLEDLTSGTEEAVPSTIGIVEEETPKWADRHFDDTDFKSKIITGS